jgi:menaquinone-dependent protoporphyrinogen oxidase
VSPEKSILIVHGGRFGQSEKIARAIQTTLDQAGLTTELVPLTKLTAPDPTRHRGLILVTSVRYGHFDKNAYRLIEGWRWWLVGLPCQLVTVSLTARKPEKRVPELHVYTRKFLEKSQWPGRVEIVAGALEYPRYNLIDRVCIQLIMKMTGGPTDKMTWIEYTDWDQVQRMAERFAALPPPAESAS